MFWRQTPRELGRIFKAAGRAATRENERAVELAHLSEWMARLKKLPSVNKLLAGRAPKPSKPQTWQQMYKSAESWVAAMQ